MRLSILATISLVTALLLGTPVAADWIPGDPYKMHFPQLPDPQGWDVNATFPKVLADDWLCTESGFVDDIHFWGSWREDLVAPISGIHLSIHANIPEDPSRPGELLWERDFLPGEWTERDAGTGDQGWYDPNTGQWFRPDHFMYYQYNFVDIPDPFYQERDTIYWLDISVMVEDPIAQWGWKTSLEHFMDDAVWGDFELPQWEPLFDPITGETLDLAFVITPEPTALAMLALGTLTFLRRR
jgi:hypothetical protein